MVLILEKKTDYATEITKIKNYYVTNAAIPSRLNDLIQKTHFNSELENVDDKVAENSSCILLYENRLKQKESRTENLERYESYLKGKNYFDDNDGTQNYLVFQCVYKWFKRVIDNISNNTYVHYWQSKGLSNEKLNTPGTNSNNDQAPLVQYDNTRISLKFSRDYLKQNKVTYNHGKTINIYIVYKLSSHTASTDFTVKNGLFGAINLTKIPDFEKYKYSGYKICFDSRGTFTHPDGSYGVNVINFGCNMSSSSHSNNRGESVLILGGSLIQEINGKILYAEKMYPTNFTVANKTFVLSLHCNGNNTYLALICLLMV